MSLGHVRLPTSLRRQDVFLLNHVGRLREQRDRWLERARSRPKQATDCIRIARERNHDAIRTMREWRELQA